MRDQLVEGPGVTDRMLRLGSNLRTRPQTNSFAASRLVTNGAEASAQFH